MHIIFLLVARVLCSILVLPELGGGVVFAHVFFCCVFQRWLSEMKAKRFNSMLQNRFMGETEGELAVEESMAMDVRMELGSPMQGCFGPSRERHEVSLPSAWNDQSSRRRCRQSSLSSTSTSDGVYESIADLPMSGSCQTPEYAPTADRLRNAEQVSFSHSLPHQCFRQCSAQRGTHFARSFFF